MKGRARLFRLICDYTRGADLNGGKRLTFSQLRDENESKRRIKEMTRCEAR